MSYDERQSKKNVRVKIRGIISMVLLLMVFVLWGLYGVLQSDLFNLKEITIHGNYNVSEEEIIQAALISLNRNILKYNLQEIKHQIENLPYVKEAIVERKLSGKLIIQVKEREEYAIISYMGSFIFIDQEGVILSSKESIILNEFPLISGVQIDRFKIGSRVQASNISELEKSIRLIEAARITEMLDMIHEIRITEDNSLILYTIDNIEVLLGDDENFIYKLLSLREVLVNLFSMNKRDVIIDLRFEGQVTVKDRTNWEE